MEHGWKDRPRQQFSGGMCCVGGIVAFRVSLQSSAFSPTTSKRNIWKATPMLRDVAMLMLETGMRPEERRDEAISGSEPAPAAVHGVYVVGERADVSATVALAGAEAVCLLTEEG